MMFVYQSRFLTRGEVWFDEEPDRRRVDWIYYRQRSNPIPRSRTKPFYTRLLDLTQNPAALWAGMEERTVRKIEMARDRDKTRWQRCDPRRRAVLDEIEALWNRHAAAERSPMMDRSWLEALLQADALEVYAGTDPQGRALTYHLVYVSPRRAQQLIAVAPFSAVPNAGLRSVVNRANCLGHWTNFLAWRERGVHYFDFGGWYPGTTNIRLLGFNAFKQGFGGQVVREFECEQVRTLKGWCVLSVARMLVRARNAGHRADVDDESSVQVAARPLVQVNA